MSYFNHAYCKTFIATKPTVAAAGTLGNSGAQAGVNNGVLTSVGVHVSKLKSLVPSEGYQLGVGTLGMFDAKTNLSVGAAEIVVSCCPFYLGGAALKLNDKQGPHHGGYQESNKSKIINPKYLRSTWKVVGNAATRAVLEIGGTATNGSLGAALTTTLGAVGGTGYVTAVGVPTTGGTGSGLTVDITVVAGNITAIAINNAGLGYTATDVITIVQGGGASDDETFTVDTVDTTNECEKAFLCGETYYLRVEAKGTSALRFANHNLYQTIQADGGCCANPASPVAVDPTVIYKQWAEGIAENPYLKDFVRPLLIVDGQAYAFDAASATAEGLDPATELFSDAPTVSTTAGIILVGAYIDTNFGDCTFQTSDYYGIEPIQLTASESDLGGDPCTFGGVCVVERCPGVQANGVGEQKVRELILSESYLQNFVANDLRIREITQGTRAYEVLSRTALYSSFFILHSVPRFNNPSGTFDNDQYLLEVVGTAGTVSHLETVFDDIETGGCITCGGTEDFSVTGCAHTVPNP